VSILLCDDHLMFLESLRIVLERRGHDVETATSPEVAVRQLDAEDIPWLVVMDLSFPDANGIDGIRAVLEAAPSSRVILLTASIENGVTEAAIEAGASAVVNKAQPLMSVVEVIERTIEAESLRGPVVMTQGSPVDDPLLTVQEREVLRLLVQGASTQQIARALNVASTTARTHIQNVLMKLGAHSRLEAASLAIRRGLVSSS
jgi:DNA-binding NarL/FixJ family response regulator